jgi:hypothetical protein
MKSIGCPHCYFQTIYAQLLAAIFLASGIGPINHNVAFQTIGYLQDNREHRLFILNKLIVIFNTLNTNFTSYKLNWNK